MKHTLLAHTSFDASTPPFPRFFIAPTTRLEGILGIFSNLSTASAYFSGCRMLPSRDLLYDV